jgi:asparagine synthase (glutamine-hydrolysing)
MYHFVALLWDSENEEARASAAQMALRMRQDGAAWNLHLSTEGICVFALTPDDPDLRPYQLPDAAGVVLGRLFATSAAKPHFGPDEHFDASTARDIVKTAGKLLVRDYWGGYVALLRDRERRRSYAIRDCSGKLPCYFTRAGKVTILFADPGDLAPLQLAPFTVNWEYLAAFIYSSQMQVRACAFEAITEILAGESLEVRAGTVFQNAIWDPRAVCRQRRIDSYDEAVGEMRKVAQMCIDRWAHNGRSVLLSLSGGFDSAVVLGCLRDSPARPPIHCLHQFSSASQDDERSYARVAAERAGITLLETPMDAGVGFDARLLAAPPTLKPTVPGLSRFLEVEAINRVATATGARTLWTGQGGDHIFLQTADYSSARDYRQTRGIRPGLIPAIRDAARVSRQSYWTVLGSALSSVNEIGPCPGELASTPYFVSREALPDNADSYVSHPWTTDAGDLPRGKRMQIRFLAEAINRHRPIPHLERAHQHHPLMSQPLIETCLQIPTYSLIRGGRERALAREAFADRLPREILRRRDKGSIVSYTTEMLRRGEAFVREVLLEGVLANAGIIAPDQLKPYIVHGQPFREEHLLPILACIAAEIWVRTCAHPVRLPASARSA